MQITCPACGTNYRIPDHAIGAEGKTVRCNKCQNRWFQASPASAEEPAEPEIKILANTVPEPVLGSLPITHAHAESQSSARIHSFATVIFAAVCGVILFLSIASVLRHKINILDKAFLALTFSNTSDIVLRDIQSEIIEVDGGRDFLLKGSLLNKSKAEKNVSLIRVEFRDADYALLKTINLEANDKKLLADQRLAFENRFTNIPVDTTTVVVDCGSLGELFFR